MVGTPLAMCMVVYGVVVSETSLPTSTSSTDMDRISPEATTWVLALGVAQLHAALRDGDDAVQQLSGSFTEMIEAADAIQKAAEALPEDSPIRLNDRAILDQVQKMVVAFQFYDRLSQRVEHVARSLEGLAELTATAEREKEPSAWAELHERIYALYSTSEERELFEALSAGAPIDGLAGAGRQDAGGDEGEVEFF